MFKYMMTLMTASLLIVQLGIAYLWVFDWRRLATKAGLMIWISSVALGILLYFIYSKFAEDGKFSIINRRAVFSSTAITIILAVFAFMIEMITQSMP
ncbi:hypothetical protein [Parageobacillus thermoglucosidasius]|uniref:Uncharacterized protein n=3 Tax=Anoxybacillaceae TaxID=3120669 RepID=A0AB38QXI2_PARTM|nr:hypothetical protein [Parageobacillus thermoglucosidasius]REK53547.1 MAG: hypothetical protein C6P36_16430 [Geobacillus sp.]AEH47866.1 hypothetical protein Geoth_1904 [Parageobacillus thermoglucosidasius C56-YS93]ALF10904.1 hypothetical protein AOT13_13270 [Parageobacillus thermoglucosidasius]ANZ30979.1 hypothetical protein BCV53_13280 [Parageobacillus thermoglucosidasius]APM81716.1 hypothetical protein BCV54_13290 [Parageobacillus thermoglucosidasius]